MDFDELYDDPAEVVKENDAADAVVVDKPGDTEAPAAKADATDDTKKEDGAEPDGATTEPVAPEDKPKEDDVKLTGVEQYLSQFDIEGGMIQFDDGSSKHFTDLDEDKQAEILSSLHSENAKAIEDKYGLDEAEIGVVNYLRENKLTFEEVVNNATDKRVSAILAMQQTGNTDFDKMEDDVLYASFLQKSNPEATQEQIEQDLEKAKSMSNYTNVVNRVRGTFKSEQEADLTKVNNDNAAKMRDELEGQRRQVVDVASKLGDIDGIELDDTMKNSVLDIVLSVDEDGDSKFMTEVFSDPQKLLKAAFWYKNGADIIKSKETYWKKEKSEAFIRGQKSKEPTGRTFSADDSKKETTPQGGNSFEEGTSLDDLYNED